MNDTKLFIPGPVQVSAKTFQALATPMIGHRSPEFVALYREIQPKLQRLFNTQVPVYLSTSSAWGVMEGAIRNLTRKRVLNCTCGAFSEKWHQVSKRCGKRADALRVDWGKPITAEKVHQALSQGDYDTITLIHNETSTGLTNPLEEIMAVVRTFPEVISIVDTVSSFSVVAIEKDKLGIDVMITGSQKALALPPGLALFSASERANQRAETLNDRGYYFDFLEFRANHEKGMTPSTPVIPHIFALRSKLEDIFEEGLQQRYARHAHLNKLVHEWVQKNNLSLFPEQSYASKALTCIKNTRKIDIKFLNEQLKKRYNCVIDEGYGPIRGETFRISNMGDETEETIKALLSRLDSLLGEM